MRQSLGKYTRKTLGHKDAEVCTRQWVMTFIVFGNTAENVLVGTELKISFMLSLSTGRSCTP